MRRSIKEFLATEMSHHTSSIREDPKIAVALNDLLKVITDSEFNTRSGMPDFEGFEAAIERAVKKFFQ